MKPAGRTKKDVLLTPKEDRRLFAHIPGPTVRPRAGERRGLLEREDKTRRRVLNTSLPEHRGARYRADFPVDVRLKTHEGFRLRFTVPCEDISTSGIALRLESPQHKAHLACAQKITLRFKIPPGAMPEGYESRVRTHARVRHLQDGETGCPLCGLHFRRDLATYVYKRRVRYTSRLSALAMLLLVALIILLRVESATYFQFNRFAYLYGIATASYLLSRYLFGLLYRPTPVTPGYTPAVSIIIPCFNEEEWIQRTIHSCLDQAYPPECLEVIVVDDCSTDASPQRIEAFLRRLEADPAYAPIRSRVRYVRQQVNQGKREAMALGARMARHDLLVYVDSDSFLDPSAILHLVQPFQDPKMGGVSGRTDVANAYTSFITRLQSVRYYVSFRIMKAAEGYFDAVTCLSGPLSCYRRALVMENLDAWLSQTFMGHRATFGDDRSMTNFILRKHRTGYQDTAVCSTIVPGTHRMFLKQQIRWKRSWLRESCIAARFMWRKEPLMAVSFYFGFLIPVLAPVIVLYNLVYVPAVFGFFPRTFLLGLFSMSLLMSVAQLLLRRNSIWPYGVYYCLYHLLVLMWQMPYAWLTFWKSTWGTRMTPADVAASRRTAWPAAPSPVSEEVDFSP